MEKRRLGRLELEITILTMGCWQAGGSSWTDTDDKNSVDALRAALDAGINFFDTAEGYGEDGHSEKIVAEALGDRRDEVLIATKVSQDNLAADKVMSACDASLKRLKTDRIDLYQIHWPAGSWDSPIVPIEETMGALVKLQAAGKIRAIGASNFNAAQITEALQYGRIDSLQPPYSLFWRPYEENGTNACCSENEIGIIAYSPLAQGLLTGKFNAGNRPADDNRSGNVLFKDPHYGQALDAVEKLKPIAQKYGVTTGQLSLQWLLGQPGVTSAIVGARNAEQVRGNIEAVGFTITGEDRQAIDRIGHSVTDGLEGRTSMW